MRDRISGTDLENMKKEIQEVIEKYTKKDQEKKKSTFGGQSLFEQNKEYYLKNYSQEDYERAEIQDQIDEENNRHQPHWFD